MTKKINFRFVLSLLVFLCVNCVAVASFCSVCNKTVTYANQGDPCQYTTTTLDENGNVISVTYYGTWASTYTYKTCTFGLGYCKNKEINFKVGCAVSLSPTNSRIFEKNVTVTGCGT